MSVPDREDSAWIGHVPGFRGHPEMTLLPVCNGPHVNKPPGTSRLSHPYIKSKMVSTSAVRL